MRKERAVPYSYTAADMDKFSANQHRAFLKFTARYFERELALNWKEVLKEKLLYKKPHLVFAAETRPDFYRQLFVLFSMMKTGKHDFVIRTPKYSYNSETYDYNKEEDEPEYMYFSTICDIRAEDVHPFHKIGNRVRHVRVFDKDKSVFAQWKEDTKASLE